MRRKRKEAEEGGRPVVYWDACVFILHLTNNQRDPVKAELVREQVRKLDDGEIIVVTSVLTLTEVLECTIPPENRLRLETLKQMPDRLAIVQVSMPIAEAAHDIRSGLKASPKGGTKTVSTADAIHVATAIDHKCEVLYTFDQNDRVRSLGLIPLSGIPEVKNLRIEKPPAPPQKSMDADWEGQSGQEHEDE